MNTTQAAMTWEPEVTPAEYANFKEYIGYKMKGAIGSNGRKTITASELADTLGMSTKVFQEILNGRRAGPDRRDFVIALCAELGLDAEETDEALRLFPGLLHRLSRNDVRDREIMYFLNSNFDVKISYRNLNQHLSNRNLPVLKTRYRNAVQNDGWEKKTMEKKKINWGYYSGQERERYNYYTSLNYDDQTASVLAIYTYGEKKVPHFSIQDAFAMFSENRPYPPEPRIQADALPFSAPCFSPAMGNSHAMYSMPIEGLDDACLPYTEEDEAAHTIGATLSLESKLNTMNFTIAEDDEPFSPPADFMACKPAPALSAEDLRRLQALGRLRTDEYDTIEEQGFRRAALNMTSTFRMTTNTASAGILLNQLRNGSRISKDMVRIEEMLNYFHYRQQKPEEDYFRISTEIRDRENGNKLLYINVQGKEEVKGRQNIVVVLDVSGSMYGNAEQTQAAVATIVSKLKPGDVFSLITYSSQDEVVIDGLQITKKEDITHILEKLLGLEIDGFTNGSAGIEKAYEIGRRCYIPDGNNQVILITDGDLNFGITSSGGLEQLIEEKKKTNLFLSVLGTGIDNFKDNKLEVLSKHGNGVYRVVNNLNDVKKSIRDEYASLVNVIAKDVKAQVEFNPELVESFRLLGFENRELRHEDFTDDTVISEPFGSGGYGVALYELVMRKKPEQVTSNLRYTRLVSTGSQELGTVKIRYKEPLSDTSHEIMHIISSAEEKYTDNLQLAWVVYVCAEKLRDSIMISQQDEASASVALDNLGMEIKVLNLEEIEKLREILRRSKQELHVGNYCGDPFNW